jgi:hypothetical protein
VETDQETKQPGSDATFRVISNLKSQTKGGAVNLRRGTRHHWANYWDVEGSRVDFGGRNELEGFWYGQFYLLHSSQNPIRENHEERGGAGTLTGLWGVWSLQDPNPFNDQLTNNYNVEVTFRI